MKPPSCVDADFDVVCALRRRTPRGPSETGYSHSMRSVRAIAVLPTGGSLSRGDDTDGLGR
jgi:hypothetical protein